MYNEYETYLYGHKSKSKDFIWHKQTSSLPQ